MNEAGWSALIGGAAAVCSTLSFLPQVLKVRRQGGRDLSVAMLALLLAGAGLWLAYGIVNQATAVVAANAAVLVLVSAIVALMVAHGDRHATVSRRLRIAIDMDEVMADALDEHLRRYNAAYGTAVTPRDLQGRPLEECIPPGHRPAARAMLDASFFEDLSPLPDCLAVVRELAERHEVFVVSAAMDVPCSFETKHRWLRRHVPFIPPSHIVFCGDKGIIDADVLIDDQPRHFARFGGKPLLFSAPHNAGETAYPRVGSWKEVRDYFARLEQTPDGRRPSWATGMPHGVGPVPTARASE